MRTETSFLPPHKQTELRAIREALIPRFAEIEMIILFGSHARGKWVEDVYTEKGTTYTYRSDYDLLILLSKNGHANSENLTQQMSQRLNELKLKTPVHPIYHGVEFVNHELREGNYFFGDIKKEGILLFSTSRYELAEKREMSAAEIQAKARRDFEKWFTSANEFFIDFENAIERNSLNNAAFHLHQATERYYGAVQLVYTGYKPKTHNIEDLGQLAKACDMAFSRVFPLAQAEELRRFELLKRAYVDARYSDDYMIRREDLDYLSERVLVLRELTESSCLQRIADFTG